MPIAVDALDHLVLNVADAEASARWYERVLGMTRGLARELGIRLPDRGEPALDVGDQRVGLLRPAERLADRLRLHLPGDAEVGVLLRLRDDGRELGERLVLLAKSLGYPKCDLIEVLRDDQTPRKN